MRTPFYALIAAVATIALAGTAAAQGTSSKKTDLYMTCSAQGLVTLSSKNKPREGALAGPVVESVNAEELLLVKNGTRAGSKSMQKVCGAFEISISAGAYNLDSMDSMGADRTYTIVGVKYKGVSLVSGKSVGACNAGDDANPNCEATWAEDIYFLPKDGGEMSIYFNGKLADSKKVPQ